MITLLRRFSSGFRDTRRNDILPIEKPASHLLASLLTMAWFVEARAPLYRRSSLASITLCAAAG